MKLTGFSSKFENLMEKIVFDHLQDGATPLFKAAHKGFSAVVNELLKYKPNLYLLPVNQIEFLIKKIFHLNQNQYFLPQNGETALHAAAMFGNLPVVKQLVAAGSDINWKNQDGWTALQVAKQQNFTSVVDYLEERRAQHNSRIKQNHNRVTC